MSDKIRYLSLEWIDELTRAVAASPSMASVAADHEIGLTQVVSDGPEDLCREILTAIKHECGLTDEERKN